MPGPKPHYQSTASPDVIAERRQQPAWTYAIIIPDAAPKVPTGAVPDAAMVPPADDQTIHIGGAYHVDLPVDDDVPLDVDGSVDLDVLLGVDAAIAAHALVDVALGERGRGDHHASRDCRDGGEPNEHRSCLPGLRQPPAYPGDTELEMNERVKQTSPLARRNVAELMRQRAPYPVQLRLLICACLYRKTGSHFSGHALHAKIVSQHVVTAL